MKGDLAFTIIWAVLAIMAFVASFYCPLLPKLIGIVFGVFNLAVVATFVGSMFIRLKNKKSRDNVQL